MKKMRTTYVVACLAAVALGLYAYATLHGQKKKGRRRLQCCLEINKKPQSRFKVVLADNSFSPFEHLKREGHKSENFSSLHPYEDQINALLQQPTFPQVTVVSSSGAYAWDSYIWVQTKSELESLAKLLSEEEIFAVDTEQHRLHSFLGFTALMQVSTLKKDYLVDTIALHDVMNILRPAFSNPCICKVFHGADNDVLWLQRDFHLYVVNLFDTKKACEVLSKPQKSLAYLLETYCGVTANKALQRADWRLRPLPEEMVQYACDDAHYLLYIAECLIKELRQKSTVNKCSYLEDAIRRSNMVTLQLYEKELEASPGDSAAASILWRFPGDGQDVPRKNHNVEKLVRQLCRWRDLMARTHDESLRCVLSDQSIWALATKVPKTEEDVYHTVVQADSKIDAFDTCASFPSPSPILFRHVKDVSCLLQEDINGLDNVFQAIVKQYSWASQNSLVMAYENSLQENLYLKLANKPLCQQNGGKLKEERRKALRELCVQKFSCKAPVYHNCRIYASDGRLLCYCDKKKLEWYLDRDLAKLVEDDPPAIMLLFEPKGRPEDEDNTFYIQSKKNMCVGCGEKSHYLRYRIIPSCYRLHFPEHLKSHRSHDIVLLCVDCHEVAHAAAEKYKKQIAVEFGIPLFVQKIQDSGDERSKLEKAQDEWKSKGGGVSPLQLRTAAMALLRHGSMMPSERREELTSVVKEYFGGREISERDLEAALLVGMSPQEKRRLKKKRGMFQKTATTTSTTTCDEIAAETSTAEEKIIIESNASNGLHLDESVNGNLPKNRSIHANSFSILNSTYIDGDGRTQCSDEMPMRDESVLGANELERPDVSQRQLNIVESSAGATRSSKHDRKLSLLGHGHHGRRVVEAIMSVEGEDGICEFCQRWRQVFVDAIHPRFLPAGWDVKHRI
ncbi:protein RRP6-like 3 isoform X2 [Nymphaea colorata]|uniref:protein RRP6-like 3 isoform X2 n=1 Tax=Nymphaea colorata TaxID=210225 RepID=UPI00129DBDD9|nr:protein RRP6-like 3 isoform X2 [Nymphaea colorata]